MLVGRRLAVDALRSAVDAAAGGAGGVVLLAGEAGMGKTALASEAVAYAKARGAAAMWGTCWEGDGACSRGFVGMWSDLATIEGFFRTGGGMSWGDHHPALNDAQARFTRPMYRTALVDGWIAALDGVTGRLQAGGTVADIGCGQGTSTITMAERFTASSFTGFDHSDAVIAAARKAADDAGLADRVSFEVADAASFPAGPGQGYDLVCFTDSLHDLGDPMAAAHARSVLAPGGTVMVIEPLAADRFEDDFTNPYARVGYAISTMVCTPSSLAQPGAAALGAMAGETRIRQVLAEAGYTRVRRVAREAAPFNIVLEARP